MARALTSGRRRGKGKGEGNVNLLTSKASIDPISGMALYSGVPVELEALA